MTPLDPSMHVCGGEPGGQLTAHLCALFQLNFYTLPSTIRLSKVPICKSLNEWPQKDSQHTSHCCHRWISKQFHGGDIGSAQCLGDEQQLVFAMPKRDRLNQAKSTTPCDWPTPRRSGNTQTATNSPRMFRSLQGEVRQLFLGLSLHPTDCKQWIASPHSHL